MHPDAIRAIATDYDRTLTAPDLEPVPEAMDALRRARKQGVRVIVLSGRSLEFLASRVGDTADAIVAENGARLLTPGGTVRELAAPLAIPATQLALERGVAIASIDARQADALRELLVRAGVDADLVWNRDRVMALPRGVSKATGLAAALAVLGIDADRCVAFGDGENDAPMLLAVGHGVAVANATEGLKRVAAEVTARPGGWGVADWVRSHILLTRTEAA